MPDFSALPALAIKSFNVLDTLDAANDYKTKQALTPLKLQEATDEAGVRHTQYGNSMLAQAADEALASDPDKAPAAWDASMNKLADQGYGIARQYVGRYDKDTARKVRNTFGERTSGGSSADQKIEAQQEQQAQQVVSQMPVEQASKSLANLNMGKEILRGVNSGEGFVAAMDKARKAGLPVDKILAGRDLNNTSPLGWQSNYAAVQRFLDDREPMRKALEQRVGNEALGLPAAPVAHNQKVVGNAIWDETAQKWITPPEKSEYQFVSPSQTGAGPGYFNKKNPQDSGPLTGPDNTADFAHSLMQSESSGNPNAKNPTDGSTSRGLSGAIDRTWVDTARKVNPALSKLSDKEISAMREQFPNMEGDMITHIVKDNQQTFENKKLPVNTATMAAAYKLGPSVAEKVMSAEPGTPMDKIVSAKVMKDNPNFKGKTAGQFMDDMKDEFGENPLGPQNRFGKPGSKAGGLTEEENDALTLAIQEDRVDASRVNSRTAPIIARIVMANPNINLVNNAGHAAMVRNAPLQRTIDVAETLPTVLENVRAAGKKLNYSDVAFFGKMDAWKKGQLNDPDFVSYMTQRNDALLSIANVMRGVGMSDKATEMEEQASNPNMSPRAVDAWADAQQKSLAPRLARYRTKALGTTVNKPDAPNKERTILRTGKDKAGKKVYQYSDGSIGYAAP